MGCQSNFFAFLFPALKPENKMQTDHLTISAVIMNLDLKWAQKAY